MSFESPEHSHVTPETLALAALGWILADQPRADRLLSLTGLTPETLREQLNDRGVLAAVLEFLTHHEPDLVACAEALQIDPAAITAAHQHLSH